MAFSKANLPNLRRLFVEARTDAEESTYSRNAFYNVVLFMSSVAVFSVIAQRDVMDNKTLCAPRRSGRLSPREAEGKFRPLLPQAVANLTVRDHHTVTEEGELQTIIVIG
ncbi:hypothetical protein CJF30_00007058 [Rutstroemia sp. NJR-2017a BBW]|nr:hypothetical protein CJF30_00007058 [Rutstroemia sp. NJR-2017a BBW]